MGMLKRCETRMKIAGYTIRNTKIADKPNEDLFFFDKKTGFVLLLDGVSRDKINGIYPDPSPAAEAAKIIQEESYAYYMQHIPAVNNPEDLLISAAMTANEKVLEYNKSKKLTFLAGAVGIFGSLQNGDFHYLYIGDCYGRIICGESVSIFTTCQTENIAKHKKEYTTYQIRNEICNNPGHACGYGVMNGDPNASFFMRTGLIRREQYDRIVLSSDGPEDYLMSCSAKQLRQYSCKKLIECSVQGTDQDDMTILTIERAK